MPGLSKREPSNCEFLPRVRGALSAAYAKCRSELPGSAKFHPVCGVAVVADPHQPRIALGRAAFLRHPCRTTAAKSVPSGEAWLHEPKLDGYGLQFSRRLPGPFCNISRCFG
jgi:hypothetical protein